MSLSRKVIDALLPPGRLWVPQDDEGLDLLLEGMADNAEAVRGDLAGLARLRHPLETPILDDLEIEYGIVPDAAVDETVRRQRLYAAKTGRRCDGSLDHVQEIIRAAGFDVYLHANNPPVDPGLFLTFGTDSPDELGDAAEEAGADTECARAQDNRLELLVNGRPDESFDMPPAEYWPLIWFVGGPATRNEAGELTAITTATVPVTRRAEFIRMLVKYKPLHSWGGLLIQYTAGG